MLKKYPAIYTDFYELTMAQGYFLSGRKNETAVFDYFFRKIPFKGGFVVFAGLGDFLELLKDYRFHTEEIEYLRTQGFKEPFLSYLEEFSFQGDIYSAKEGEVVFSNTPLIRVEGAIIETQIIETLLLNIINFESLIATKAARIREAAGKRLVLDFGLRRSQGFGGIQASKASVIGGLNGSSNVYAGLVHGLNVSGTMAYLSKKARKQLDDAGFPEIKIAASNQLDEYLIKSLLDQKAPIDIFGVGTKLVTAYDNPALDGVYKLASINNKPTLKISENVEKITLPGIKKVTRYLNKDGSFYADGISLESESKTTHIEHPYFPTKRTRVEDLDSELLLTKIVEKGKLLIDIPNANESAEYCKQQIQKLSPEYKRFDNPHVYKIGITKELKSLRDQIIKTHSN